ncbi:MAG: DUF1684 domain-containing protein [Janthinobacterium lividum]
MERPVCLRHPTHGQSALPARGRSRFAEPPHFHGLNFYPANPVYGIAGRWVPYTTPHSIHMGTVLGTVLVVPSPGYVEFVVDGQTVHLDAMGGEKQISLPSVTALTRRRPMAPAARSRQTCPPMS